MISLWSKILKKQSMADLCTASVQVIILTVNSQLIAVWPLSVFPSSNGQNHFSFLRNRPIL